MVLRTRAGFGGLAEALFICRLGRGKGSIGNDRFLFPKIPCCTQESLGPPADTIARSTKPPLITEGKTKSALAFFVDVASVKSQPDNVPQPLSSDFKRAPPSVLQPSMPLTVIMNAMPAFLYSVRFHLSVIHCCLPQTEHRNNFINLHQITAGLCSCRYHHCFSRGLHGLYGCSCNKGHRIVETKIFNGES